MPLTVHIDHRGHSFRYSRRSTSRIVVSDTPRGTHATWCILARALSPRDGFLPEVYEVLSTCHAANGGECWPEDDCPIPPTLYSGPRCERCGGDHFPEEMARKTVEANLLERHERNNQ